MKLDLKMLAEFSVAAKLSGARSNSTFVNQFVVQKIREAKQLVSKEEFEELVKLQLEEIEERSERKSEERRKSEFLKKYFGKSDDDVIELSDTQEGLFSKPPKFTDDEDLENSKDIIRIGIDQALIKRPSGTAKKPLDIGEKTEIEDETSITRISTEQIPILKEGAGANDRKQK